VGVKGLFDIFGEDFIGNTIGFFKVSNDSLVSKINESCDGFKIWYLSWK